MNREDRATIGGDLRKLQFGWPVGMPLVRKLGPELWELRCTLRGHREARLLFAASGDQIVVLHGFLKKSQKTPPGEIALAQNRLKEMLA